MEHRTELSDEQAVALALDDPGYFRVLYQLLEEEQASAVQQALTRLPARDREMISLRFAGGL